MERTNEAPLELTELGRASTDTRGAVFGEVEWSGLFPKAGILSD